MSLTNDEIVREQILLQAQKLFKQFGLRKTTMDEIAAECGKAKSTLYHYFKSKEEVFDGVIDIELRNLRIVVKERVDKVETTKGKITEYFLEFHQGVLNKINLYRIVKHELVSKSMADSRFSKIMSFEKSYVTRILEDGYDTGEFNKVEKSEIAWYAELIIAAFFGIVKYSIESDEDFNQDKLKLAAEFFIPKLFV